MDLELAGELLRSDGLTLAIVHEGRELYRSREHGILPLARACGRGEAAFAGASAADIVVGRAAAILFARLGVAKLRAQVVSKGAMEIFRETGIRASCESLVESIRNRQGDGLCPMEKLSIDLGAGDSQELLRRIGAFFSERGIQI